MPKLETQFDITKKILSLNPKEFSLTPTTKFVLVQLSYYFGDRGNTGHFSCYPSQTRLANETGFARATVLNALKKCEELGFISSNFRVSTSGDPTSKLYHWKGIPTQQDEHKESKAVIDVSMESESIGTDSTISAQSITRTVDSSNISRILEEWEVSPF